MLDTTGGALVVSPDANLSEPVQLVFDKTQPRLFDQTTITLDRERRLRLSFKALRVFEQETGINPWDEDAVNSVWKWPPPRETILTLLWQALLDDDPSLTREQLEDLPGMEFGNIAYIRYCLNRCWGENQPPADRKGTNGTAPNAKRPPG